MMPSKDSISLERLSYDYLNGNCNVPRETQEELYVIAYMSLRDTNPSLAEVIKVVYDASKSLPQTTDRLKLESILKNTVERIKQDFSRQID
ncbi:hypothetical protein KW787_03145 [Candidatus Pacearchaeota archaeon]|nr:hypothetical protein [Candidatus Pacearchaeota archaeon]